MTQVVDYSFARPGAQAIKDANYGGAIRYLAPRPNEKVWDYDQLQEHLRLGLSCGFVWETTTGRAVEGYDAGVTDAQRANIMCDEMGVPGSVGIYYAVDRNDLIASDVYDYFRGVLSVDHRASGVYGSQNVVESMMNLGCRYGWQVETWGNYVSNRAHLVQLPNVHPRIGGVDVNDVLQNEWGAWVPDGAVVIQVTTPAAPTEPYIWPTLRRGMSGQAVREMQQVMANRGWGLDADGDFGTKTENVVIAFQREKGLMDDGVVGPITKDAMLNDPTNVAGGDAVPSLPTMRRGDSGPSVVMLQQKLADRGWSIGVDGNFGRQTFSIVTMFQQEKGLDPDGIAGPLTIRAIWTAPEDVTQPAPAPPVDPTPVAPPAGMPGTEHPDPVGQIEAWGFVSGVLGFQRAFAHYDLAVDGDAGAETAKAVQLVVDNGEYLSTHFSIEEWKCKHCGRIKGERATFRSLETERELVGPIAIISGFRCDEHNAAIGGATLSQHRFGTAGDKNTKVWSSEQAGFTGIGTCGDDCLHGDRGDVGEYPTRQVGVPTYWSYC